MRPFKAVPSRLIVVDAPEVPDTAGALARNIDSMGGKREPPSRKSPAGR